MFTTVIVDATNKRRPFEVCRYLYDPQEDSAVVEGIANRLSRDGRLIRVYCDGRYVRPWRKQKSPEYESLNGEPTPDYRTIGAR